MIARPRIVLAALLLTILAACTSATAPSSHDCGGGGSGSGSETHC